MTRLRAAVVGVGYLGTFHSQKYKALSTREDLGVDLIAVCDKNPEQANRVAAELDVQAYSNPQDLIGKVDLVTIATITPAHFEAAEFFLKNKIHVNVEKPITQNVDEGEKLVSLAKENGLILSVGQSERFSPAWQDFRKRNVTLKAAEFNRLAPFNPRGVDVSVIHDLMIHDLDLLLQLPLGKPELLLARGGCVVTQKLDWATAIFKFPAGQIITVNSSRMNAQMTRTFRAYDENTQYQLNFQTGDLLIGQKSKESSGFEVETVACGRGDNLLLETEAFIQAIRRQKSLYATGEQGLEALRWVERISEEIHRLGGGI